MLGGQSGPQRQGQERGDRFGAEWPVGCGFLDVGGEGGSAIGGGKSGNGRLAQQARLQPFGQAAHEGSQVVIDQAPCMMSVHLKGLSNTLESNVFVGMLPVVLEVSSCCSLSKSALYCWTLAWSMAPSAIALEASPAAATDTDKKRKVVRAFKRVFHVIFGRSQGGKFSERFACGSCRNRQKENDKLEVMALG